MKSALTRDQLRKMYNPQKAKPIQKETQNLNKEIRIREGTDMVLVEVAGRNHRLPTWAAFNRLLEENKRLRSEVQTALGEIKVLEEVIRQVGQNVDYVNDELKNKIDKP